MVTVDETLVREILDRLIRLEALIEGTNQRLDDVNRRLDDVNRRLDDINARLEETNRRIDELGQSLGRRIDDVNQSVTQRIDESNARNDARTEGVRREMRLDVNRQTFLIMGFGAALLVSVVTAVVFG